MAGEADTDPGSLRLSPRPHRGPLAAVDRMALAGRHCLRNLKEQTLDLTPATQRSPLSPLTRQHLTFRSLMVPRTHDESVVSLA